MSTSLSETHPQMLWRNASESGYLTPKLAGDFFATPLDTRITQGAQHVVHIVIRNSSTDAVENASPIANNRPRGLAKKSPNRLTAAPRKARSALSTSLSETHPQMLWRNAGG
ncbi:hypothetical protein [Thermomonas hydrothermalis]|uniref:hypothetical protein n=1 Tax=Thermomonas hydrothermalis TaxID=213588 RepID=UPI0011603B63|nr:hypothetical protein [Thermomonas hydrothermalis]MCL6620441.1 hypothetical protein [Thermomonas hydrothermalis]